MDYDTYISLKIIIAGDTNVGKSTIFKRIQNKGINIYKEPSTIGMDFARIDYIIDNKRIKVHLWDTAGQEKYHCIIRSYFREICGVILMFDVSKTKSFNNLKKWLDLIVEEKRCKHDHPILLFGNKNDLPNVINSIELNNFIKEHNMIYHEISSSNNNLEEIFKAFVSNIIQNENIADCKGMKDISVENKRVTLLMKETKNQYCCFN
jgi:small GTP-binding protein